MTIDVGALLLAPAASLAGIHPYIGTDTCYYLHLWRVLVVDNLDESYPVMDSSKCFSC